MDFYNESKNSNILYGSIISIVNQPNFSKTFNSFYKFKIEQPIEKFNEKTYYDYIKKFKFIYSDGVFDEFCYLNSFVDEENFKMHFFNTLFLVLPPLESYFFQKYKSIINKLKNEILMDETVSSTNQQILDFYNKFKQELQNIHFDNVVNYFEEIAFVLLSMSHQDQNQLY